MGKHTSENDVPPGGDRLRVTVVRKGSLSAF